MPNKRLFVCYSVPLMKQLQKEGFKYEVVGLNPDTRKTFYIFIRDEKLNTVLKNWSLCLYK